MNSVLSGLRRQLPPDTRKPPREPNPIKAKRLGEAGVKLSSGELNGHLIAVQSP